MNAVYNTIAPILGLGVEPKALTFTQISLRGVVVLTFTLILVRLGDKRSLSKKSAFDAALLVILASVLSRAINGSASFFATLGGSAVIVALHRIIAYLCCRSDAVRALVKGRPSVLVRQGAFQRNAMHYAHVHPEDVHEDMRLTASTDELSEIEIGRLECSGDISFIKKTRAHSD